MIGIRITGLKEAAAAAGTAGPRYIAEVRDISYRWAEAVMTKAKLLTPVDTGALRSSGHVQDQSSASVVRIVLGFGGPSAGYAVYVHENLHAHHPVGQAKFLETPFNESLADLERALRGR